jgi:hypothetical protein
MITTKDLPRVLSRHGVPPRELSERDTVYAALGIEDRTYRDETQALSFYFRETWWRSDLKALPIEPRDSAGGGAHQSAENRRAQVGRIAFCMSRLLAIQRAVLDAHFGLDQSYSRIARLGKVLREGGDLRYEFGFETEPEHFHKAFVRMRRCLPDNAKTVGRYCRDAKQAVKVALQRAGLLDSTHQPTYERIERSPTVYRRPRDPAEGGA